MSDSTALESFRYALNIQLVKLYIVTISGWLLFDFSQSGFNNLVDPLPILISTPFILCGLTLFIGGLIGVLHRVLSDTISSK